MVMCTCWFESALNNNYSMYLAVSTGTILLMTLVIIMLYVYALLITIKQHKPSIWHFMVLFFFPVIGAVAIILQYHFSRKKAIPTHLKD